MICVLTQLFFARFKVEHRPGRIAVLGQRDCGTRSAYVGRNKRTARGRSCLAAAALSNQPTFHPA